MRRSSVGVTPAAMARSSIAGAIASMTQRTSFGRVELTLSAAQDAQPGVLLAGARALPDKEPGEDRDRDIAERVQQRNQRCEQQRRGIEVGGQRLSRLAVGQPGAGARD